MFIWCHSLDETPNTWCFSSGCAVMYDEETESARSSSESGSQYSLQYSKGHARAALQPQACGDWVEEAEMRVLVKQRVSRPE